MAKIKKEDGAAILLGIIAFVIWLLFVALSIIAATVPIVIILGYIYYFIKTLPTRKIISGTMSDFWLNEADKDSFKAVHEGLIVTGKIIDNANNKGLEAGISRNQDGSFSARSKLGKEIRQTLSKYEPLRDDLRQQLSRLQYRPWLRWDEFNSNILNAKSFIWSFYSWCGVNVYFAIDMGKQSISDILMSYWGMATLFFRDEADVIQVSDDDYRMVIVAAVVAIVSFILIRLIFKRPAQKYTPEPDEVTMENLYEY